MKKNTSKPSPPRIIAGEYRGRRLVYPPGADIRPTTDRVKEALFNILQADITGAEVLDLFAGTGSIGLEALSRGAERVVFADKSRLSTDAVRANINMLGCQDKARVLNCGYDRALNTINRPFDIIYIDPPYESGFYHDAISIIGQRKLLKPNGIIAVEHNAAFDTTGLSVVDNRKYGTVEISFIRGISV